MEDSNYCHAGLILSASACLGFLGIGDIAGEMLANFDRLTNLDIDKLREVEGNPRLGSCVGGTGKFICFGLNYAVHAKESGMDAPSALVHFYEINFGYLWSK